MIFNNKNSDNKQRFSIRKLSIGVCSVLLSTLFFVANDNQVEADTTESTSGDTTSQTNTDNSDINQKTYTLKSSTDVQVAPLNPVANTDTTVTTKQKVATADQPNQSTEKTTQVTTAAKNDQAKVEVDSKNTNTQSNLTAASNSSTSKNTNTATDVQSNLTAASNPSTSKPTAKQAAANEQVNFTIDFWDDTDNKLLYADHLVNPGNGGYDHVNFPAGTFPAGVGANTYQSVSVTGVPQGVTIAGSYWVLLTDPNSNWWIPNFKWTDDPQVIASLNDAVITVHVSHKTKVTTENETRTLTVKNINANTGQSMGTQAPDSVLNAFYTRTKTFDLVTNTTTYSAWQLDTSKGTNGYQIASGNWNLQDPNVISADNPDVKDYTVFDQGDWEIGSDGSVSNTPANEFTTSYNPDATNYESQSVHTVYYAQLQQDPRTVTENFKIAGGPRDGQDYAPAAQVIIYYSKTPTAFKTNGSTDPSKWTISYTDWSWNKSLGDPATPGFHVISGSWNLATSTNVTWGPNTPAGSDQYTEETLKYDGGNSSVIFAATAGSMNFTSNTGTWYYRNELTTYYIDNSELNKNITRTINITKPGESTTTETQTGQIKRTAAINADDTGVVYSNWNTSDWKSYQIPQIAGYIPIITQTVNGVTTTITDIPAQTVDFNTPNAVIDIRYTATATATLKGAGTNTYTGSAPTPDNFGQLKINVTGPTANIDPLTLAQGDVEFSTDGITWTTNPVDAGTYQVRLTTQGIDAVKQHYGNNSIVWDQDGQSTITSNATFTINPSANVISVSGTQTATYSNNPVSVVYGTNGITISINRAQDNPNGAVADITKINLGSNDFQTDAPDGQAINAGNYKVTLTNVGLHRIQQALGSNYTITTDNSTGTLVIKKATATVTLGGTDSMTYTGQPVNINNITADGNIKVTITNNSDIGNFPTTLNLRNPDYLDWYTQDGTKLASAPTDAGTYTVKLSQTAIRAIKNMITNPDYVDADLNSIEITYTNTATFTINQDPVTTTISGQEGMTYTGQPAQFDPASIKNLTLTSQDNNFNNIDLTIPTWTSADFDWYDASDNLISAPTKVGTYYLRLNTKGQQALADANQNYSFVNENKASTINGQIDYSINMAVANAQLGGTATKDYDGQAFTVSELNNGSNNVAVSLTILGKTTTYTLKDGDFTWNTPGNAAPINASTYTITLTQAGRTNLQNYIDSIAGKGENPNTSNVILSPQITNTAQITINKRKITNIVITGNQNKTFDTQAGTLDINDLTINGDNTVSNTPLSLTGLTAADFDWYDGTQKLAAAPINANKYVLQLNSQGLQVLIAANSNYSFDINDIKSAINYQIEQAKANATLGGANSMIYNGSSVTVSDLNSNGSTIEVTITGANLPGLPTSFNLTDSSYYEWLDQTGKVISSPIDAGKYTIRLTQAGMDAVQAAIDQAEGKGNVLTSLAGTASFEIKQEVAENVELHGQINDTYNGSQVSFDPIKAKDYFGFNNVTGLKIPDFTSDDFEWVDQNGNLITAPTDVGVYYLQLNDKGKQAFADANKNYSFVDANNKSTISGRITYDLDQADLTIDVSSSASKVYDGNQAEINQDQIDYGEVKVSWNGNTNEPAGLEQITLKPDDFEVVDADGNPVSQANASMQGDKIVIGQKYTVKLTTAALAKIKALTGVNNYKINVTEAGQYLIYARRAQLTVSGNQTTAYGTVLPFDVNQYYVTLSNWQGSDKPNIKLQAGDLYIAGYADTLPTNVGSYNVFITDQLLDRLQKDYPDYDFSGLRNMLMELTDPATSDSDPLHTPATYNIIPANTTVTINGVEHIKYGETPTINYGGDNGYTISITAPVKNATETNPAAPIYTKVTLSAGDLEFVTAPANKGDYTVKLSAQGLQKLKDLTGSTNYNWDQAALAKATFVVDQMPVDISISGDQSVTYGTSQWLTAIKNNPDGYTISVNTADGTKVNYQAKQGDLVFGQTPGDVGTYQVKLSGQGLQNIEQALGSNYTYPQSADAVAAGTFTVDQGQITVTLNGSDQKTFDDKQTKPSYLDTSKYNLNYSVTIYAPDGTSKTLTLTGEDLQFVNADPINVREYQVELSQAGKAKLQALAGNNGTNYSWTFDSNASFSIVESTDAKAALSGSNQMTYNGQTVTLGDLTNGGTIEVILTFPGSNNNNDIYKLQTGDFMWNTADGKAPKDVGNYTITLTAAGLTNLQKAIDDIVGAGNVKLSADQLTGSANFKINPPVAKAILNSGSEKIYNGQATSVSDVLNSLKWETIGLAKGDQLNTSTLTASDYEWVDEKGQVLASNPINAGIYYLKLTASGINKIKVANSNYSFAPDAVSGEFTYTITTATGNVTFSGSDERDYNGQATSVSDVLNKITWTAPDLTIPTLTSNDFEWANSTDPTTVGTYHLQLTASGIAKIKAANPNYSFTPDAIGGKFTYTINAAHGAAVLSGSNSKPYDGQAVSVADVDSKSGNIVVHLTFPGSTDNTYELQIGDYTWNTKDGSAPIDVGNYTITLTDVGIANLQKKIDSIAGAGNVTLSGDTGSASFEITQKDATVTLDQKSGTDVEKTYDGKAASFDPSVSQLTATGLVAGQSLNTANLTPDDYSFVDAKGNILSSAPVDAGNYGIKLNAKGLAKLQKDNPNYHITESGVIEYKISAAKASATLSGSNSMIYSGEAVTTANVNKDNNIIVHLNFPGSSDDTYTLQDGDYEFVDSAGNVLSAPKDAQKYSIRLTKLGLQHLQAKIDAIVGADNAVLASENVTATATFTIDPKPITDVKITGNNLSQNKDYDGKTANLDLSGLTLTGDGVLANTPLADLGLSASDFDWYDADSKKLVAAPTDAGNYQARLKVSALALLQKANPNYSFSSVSGIINYTINQKVITISISGQDGKTYDGTPADLQKALDLIKWDITGLVDGQTLNTSNLTADDYSFYEDKDTKLLVAPTEVGNYLVKLNQKGLEQLQKDNPNYQFKITSKFTYVISKAISATPPEGNKPQEPPTNNGSSDNQTPPAVSEPDQGSDNGHSETGSKPNNGSTNHSETNNIKHKHHKKPSHVTNKAENLNPMAEDNVPVVANKNNGFTTVSPKSIANIEQATKKSSLTKHLEKTETELPQTGRANNDSLELWGTLLASIGSLSLFGYRKRKKDK